MRKRKIYSLYPVLVSVLILLAMTGALTALGKATAPNPTASIEVNLHLAGDPATLDPALVLPLFSDPNSLQIVEQLFAGLFDLDDVTGELEPELATGYEVDATARVYTVTMQAGLKWSDEEPLDAGDVVYGIQRALAPATDAGMAYILFPILNAEAYHDGSLLDPNEVGVTAIDSTHVRFELEYPAAYFPNILTSAPARPVPQHTIMTWGAVWTAPEHIVSSGAYVLTGFEPGNDISLHKNPFYVHAGTVEINSATYTIEGDPALAWNLYLNGELDSYDLPVERVPDAKADPILQQELFADPSECSYYYGFVNNKPPFDDARVRKAFIMASDRVGMIQNVLGYGQQPAQHFTPPGIFGSPASGTVGYGYNPTAAQAELQAYLDAKEMTLGDFQALGIELMYNTSAGHQAIAEYLQGSWFETLGISVTLTDQDWSTYLNTIQTSTPLADMPHIFRLGWCADYPDAHNFVHDDFNNQQGLNRLRRGCLDETCTAVIPQAFDLLTWQAAAETDPAAREALYAQAEQELAGVEAAYLPLYWYASPQLTRPHLERTEPRAGAYDLAEWRFLDASTVIPTNGGSLLSPDGTVELIFPADTFASSTVITYTPTTALQPGGDLLGLVQTFELEAVNASTGLPITPDNPYTLRVFYPDSRPVVESTLSLYFWDNGIWNAEFSSVDPGANTVTAAPDHMSVWGLFGETRRIFLPSIVR